MTTEGLPEEYRVRRAIRSAAVLFLVVLGVPVMAAAPNVSLEPARTIFEAGETIEFRVVSERNSPIFIPGCGALQPEIFVEDRYDVLPPPSCADEGVGRVLNPGTNSLRLDPPPELVGETARVSMVYGIGCVEGRPLSRARCSDFNTVWSGNFRLKAPAP